MSKKDSKKLEEELEKELSKVVEESDNEENSEQLSDTDNDGESEYDESDFEEIDVTDNPLYQVLSAFFETEEGENLCDILKDLGDAVRENTKMMSKLLKPGRK